MEQDIRWLQRYDSYCKACKRVLQVTESERQPDELTGNHSIFRLDISC